jgi:deferrochelatase/peroxidase EfeB
MPTADIQRMIVFRPEQAAKAILFFRIRSRSGTKDFLRSLLTRVPSAAAPLPAGKLPLHVSVTWSGIEKLLDGHADLLPAEGKTQLEPWFVSPEAAFSHPEELGFIEDSAPDTWWDRAWTNADIDLALHVFAEDADQLRAELDALKASAGSTGMEALVLPTFEEGTPAGTTPAGGILHFGFRDGITNPDIDWEEDGTGTVDKRELLLGYRTADYPTSPFRDGPWKDFVRDGSLACVAWIGQDAAGFDDFLTEAADQVTGLAPEGLERDWLASRMMGRWFDGSPVMRWPDRPPDTPDLRNDFGFATDPKGERCPLTTHIRVANLRDDPMTFPNKLVFPKGPPRFMRRGFSYGPAYRKGDDRNIPRGLVGTFFCARLNEQFLKVLRWIHKTDFSEGFFRKPYAANLQDACFGTRGPSGGSSRMPIAAAFGHRDIQLARFITFRGVAVLLMPSLPSLARLAEDI